MVSSFVEEQFPTNIAYGATGGARYSTDIVEMFSGQEQRNINWSAARGKWDVSSGIKTLVQLEDFVNFFHARRGRAVGFRFKDWSDYQVTNGNIGVGDNSETEFQLRKQYTSGAVTVNRIITKPVSGSISVYKDAVLQTVTTHYTVDTTTGIITFVSAPGLGAVITASFQFDVPVRFDTDELGISVEALELGQWGSIPIIEVRV